MSLFCRVVNEYRAYDVNDNKIIVVHGRQKKSQSISEMTREIL